MTKHYLWRNKNGTFVLEKKQILGSPFVCTAASKIPGKPQKSSAKKRDICHLFLAVKEL